MKKVKRLFSLLCCMALIVSLTIDAHAAEEISLMMTDAVDEVRAADDSSGEMTGNEASADGESAERDSKEDETENDSGSIQNTEAVRGTENEESSGGSESETENEERETASGTKTEEGSADKTDGSEETLTETETDKDSEEETTDEKSPDEDSADAVSVNNIFDDAYVSNMSGVAGVNYAASQTLIFGKLRHIYLRLDLSGIKDSDEKIVFQGSWAKGDRTTVVVTESSEYLRSDDGNADGTEKWTMSNITYNNRPLDVGTAICEQLEWSSGPLEIDLTEFVKGKVKGGAVTACIHITTVTVDDEKIGAVEIHSSRAADESKKPKLVITPAKLSENNIFDDAVVSNFQGNENNNFKTADKLTFGKKRHVYLRFDLSDIDENAGEIVFQGERVSGATSKTIVVTESSEYLRADDTTDGAEKWTTDNITYNNRPLDTDNVIYDGLEWSSGAVKIDLTEFIKSKLSAGARTACIHITTTTVDTENDAVDMASSRHADASKRPRLVVAPAVKPSVNNIFDDAYVSNMSGAAGTNYASSQTLQFGKFRHAYIRFDLSDIAADADKIVFRGTYAKGTRKPVVVTESSEYLRADDATDGTEKWTTDNITYSNRPLDTDNVLYDGMEWPNSQTNLEIDLTDFIKAKIKDKEETACIHITTTTVEQDAVGAVEINSSRSDSGKPGLIVSTPNDEKPVDLERGINAGDYYDNGYIIQKVVKIKTSDDEYLKADADGAVSTTGDAQQAGLFGLHIYQYDEYERENYGATKTTYAFENLDTGKFLTIQNYFAEDDSSKDYYNLDNGKYIIKATAPDVNWNERFDVRYYPESKYYTIASHLQVYRDGSDAVSPLYVENGALKCGKNDEEFRFYMEEVENQDRLKILQEVHGKSVKLFWKPINGDQTPGNYTIAGQSVSYDADNDMLYTQISNLSTGLHKYTVVHSGQQAVVQVRIFEHLALAHSQEQLDAMKAHVERKEEPWYSDYQRLLNQVPYNMSDSSFEVSAQEGVGRGDPAGHGNIGAYERSSNAAYFNALQWVITGEEQYARKVVEILNAWAGTLKIVDGRDRILGAAISTYRMNNAAEIIKYYNGGYSGYSDEEFKEYQDMLLNVIYPVVQDLGLPMKANGNWDTAAMAAMVTIGAVCENTEIFERAVYLYQDIHTNGSIAVYVSDWGQSVESYRDQAHAQLGISYLADVCETAKRQGIDLYGLYDNRLAKGFNWAAQYNLYNTENLRTEPLTDVFGQKKWTTIDSEKINRGELRSVYELPLAHYSSVSGVDVTWMQKAAEAMRPQGYVNNDHLNFGTLTTYNGETDRTAEPYFQLRTRLEPWYQRSWNDAKKYGEILDNIPETLNSYFTVDESGNVTVSAKKADAPFFQLEKQGDGTYAIRCVATNRYLSVKDENYCDGNVIRADAKTVSDQERFVLKGTGASFFYLEAPAFGNRILNVNVENETDPENAELTLYLGSRVTSESDTVTNNERYILVYNTEDVALEGIASVDASALEDYINSLPEINNDDNKYTAESYQEFSEKLEAAKESVQAAKDGTISQREINGALQALKDAYENLERNNPAEELTVSAPKADIESGEIPVGTKITLTCATQGASIYYTTDRSEPGRTNGTLYENPISADADMVIKAVAVKDGYKDSEVVTYEYTISDTDPEKFVYAPTADTPSGTVVKGTQITLTCATKEAVIYYTTDASIPDVSNGTLYENPIPVNESVTIKAIAVKGENTSAVSTFVYEVSGENPDEKPVQVSEPTADIASRTEVLKGTRITLTCATQGAVIYYTTDGSTPSASNGERYQNPIVVRQDITIKAVAVKDDVSSTVGTFTYTISVGLRITVDGVSYNCAVGETIVTGASYVYTGSAVMPEVTVTNNGEVLAEGTDYTVKYANNIKVPAANAKNAQKPKITITGKNNLKGNAVLYFTIRAKSIASSEDEILTADPLTVVENKKASPILYYGGQLLKINKDFTMDLPAKKWTAGDNNGEITLTGKGNYTGERKIKVNVAAKNTLQKFKVKLDAGTENVTYDGKAHEPQFTVYNANDTDKEQIGADNYYVVMTGDAVSAGTKKFTVVGTGMYTGCSVTKSYTIKPCTDSSSIRIDNSGQKEEYTYTRSGVVFEEGTLAITCGGNTLKEGKDYKITYSGNKKVTDNAKYSVTFLGNYKGVKNVAGQTGSFRIVAADLSRQDWEAVALDKTYKKPGSYKTKLYVSVDNVLLKSSDYTITYRLSDGSTMAGKNKLDLDKVDGIVTVLIEGKGNYTGTVETSYRVYKPDSMYDLSKAKVTVVGSDGSKLKNVQFDGNEQTVSLKIEVKDGKKYREITSEEYSALSPHITYINNVYKGKAVIVLNGDGKNFAGSKAVTFGIVSKDITTKK